jgi:hypothetical protein
VKPDGETFRAEPALAWESAFRRELRHFHDCITRGTPCHTPVESARDDIALIIEITRAFTRQSQSLR